MNYNTIKEAREAVKIAEAYRAERLDPERHPAGAVVVYRGEPQGWTRYDLPRCGANVAGTLAVNARGVYIADGGDYYSGNESWELVLEFKEAEA
jgi:hypothetical protein